MNYSEVKKELKKEFESFLKPLGYKSKSEAQGCEFSLIKGNQNLRIGYGVANYIDEFNTACYSKISLLPIQRVQIAIFGEEGTYDTLTNSIAMYFDEINYRYKIKTIEDVKAWGVLVRKFYEESIVPFFEKYNSVNALDELVNTIPADKVIYCNDLYWQAMNGLISAKLNNNPKYSELSSYYKTQIERIYGGHFNYDKSMKVIDFLERHSTEELKKITESPN